jgi:hypothetical protein
MNTLTLKESEKDLKRRIVELELEISSHQYDDITYKRHLNELQEIIDAGPIISEEQYLRSIETFQKIIQHYRRRMIRSSRNKLECSFCSAVKKRMTMFYCPDTGEILNLCFLGCQHFPEAFRDTEAGVNGDWIRIDPWQDHKRKHPKLRKNFNPVGKLNRQSKLIK